MTTSTEQLVCQVRKLKRASEILKKAHFGHVDSAAESK